MNDENEAFEERETGQERTRRDPKISILYAEVFCIALLLTGLMALKMFFPNYFGEIKKWYQHTFLTETSVSDVLDGSSSQSSSDRSTTSSGSLAPDKNDDTSASSETTSSSDSGMGNSGSTATGSTDSSASDQTGDTSDGESHAF